MARASSKRPPELITTIRHTVQMTFLRLNVCIGAQFYA